MGNKSSTQVEKPEIYETENVDYLIEFYKDPKGETPYHKKAEKMYQKMKGTDDGPDIFIEKRVEIFVDPERGLEFPYESQQPLNLETSERRPIITSENPRYIEFIVCQGDLGELKEKHAVHKTFPDHECPPNCKCIQRVIGSRPSSFEEWRKTLSLSPTSSSPASCPVMKGGQDDSPEEITESEEIKDDKVFSDTSDLEDMTTTDTTPIDNTKKKKKKKGTTEIDIEEELDIENDDEDEDKNYIEDEDDELDEELEDIEDEDITEDGLLSDQTDITSTDLYRMQSRIFSSETDEDEQYSENVRKAMGIAERRGMYDSEEKDIMDMNSSSERYMQKSIRRNSKYY